MTFLNQFEPMTKAQEAWSKIKPLDDFEQTLCESDWWRERTRNEAEQCELAMAIIDELGIEKPVVTKEQGKDHAIAVTCFRDWCHSLGLTEYLNLPPCFTAKFLQEMISAGAKPSEVRWLCDGISYAHQRVFLSDPTRDADVRKVIKRRK